MGTYPRQKRMSDNIPDITVSIVNTNNRDIVLQCLESVYSTAGDLSLQVVVVNNACSDGSTAAIRARFRQVEIIEQNLLSGFSTNNNLAFARAKGRYLLMLNDDTIVHPDALQKLIAFVGAHPEVGVVGPKLMNKDGSWQPSFGYKLNPLHEGLDPLWEYIHPRRPTDQPVEVGCVSGACMFIRSAAAQVTGYLDTRFDPIYSEEIDWCYRIVKAGYKIFYVPDAIVTHLGGSTMDRTSTQRFIRIHEKKAVLFRKHYHISAVLIYKVTLLVANLIKLVYWAILCGYKQQEAREEVEAHWKLIKRIPYM